MKYKDRIPAKNKYKKALLATAATFTLALGTVGSFSMIPTAAHAESTNAQDAAEKVSKLDELLKKYTGSSSATIQGQFQGFMDNGGQAAINALKIVGPDLYSIVIGGKVVDPVVLNRLAKNLTMIGVSAIPGVGGLTSSILGMIWPEAHGANPMDIFKEQMTQLINTTVANSEKASIEGELTQVINNMKGLDSYITHQSSFYDGNGANSYVVNINTSLKKMLNTIEKSQFKDSELSFYVAIATMDLTFMKFVEANAKNPDLGMSEEDLIAHRNARGGDLKTLAKKYRDNILSISHSARAKNYQEIVNYITGVSTGFILGGSNTMTNANIGETLNQVERTAIQLATLEQPKILKAVQAARVEYNKFKSYDDLLADNSPFGMVANSILGKEIIADKYPNKWVSVYSNTLGKYFEVQGGENGLQVAAKANAINGVYQEFMLEPVNKEQNTFRLARSVNGKKYYMTINGNLNGATGGIDMAQSTANDSTTVFKLISVGEDQYVIRGIAVDTYVKAWDPTNGYLTAAGVTIDKDHTFTIKAVTPHSGH